MTAVTDAPAAGRDTAPMNELVACPEPGCLVAAEVAARWVWPSTAGPVEHVKLLCLAGHARTLPTAWLAGRARPVRVAHPSTRPT